MERSKPHVLTAVSLEREAVRREGAGLDAFEDGLVASRPRLFRVALLLLGSREEAEDATQKTLLRALEARRGFRGDADVYTWLYRILVNTCKDAYKTRSRVAQWLRGPVEGGELEVAAAEPTCEEALVAAERDARVRRAMTRLDAPHRQILVLRHFEEMSYEDMARVLDVPLGTVRSRLSAARERLREELVR